MLEVLRYIQECALLLLLLLLVSKDLFVGEYWNIYVDTLLVCITPNDLYQGDDKKK